MITDTISTTIATTTTDQQPIITVEPTTMTTTSSRSFSDNIITVDLPSTTQTTKTVNSTPSESPYGVIKSNNKDGRTMLIVSLAVVFAVLAGIVLVIMCLFCRRRRRKDVFGKASNSRVDSILASAGQHRSGGSGGADGNGASSVVASSHVVQEMTEQHHDVLQGRRGSNLSQGSGYYTQGSRPSSRVLSPTSTPTRSFTRATGNWSGTPSGLGSGNMDASTITSNGECASGSLESSQDLRSSQYGESYLQTYAPPHPPYAITPGGSSASSSNDQLLNSNHSSHRSSPSLRPQLEALQTLSTSNQMDYRSDSPLGRPQSMASQGATSNIVIPPSITTRPRSMMNPNGMYQDANQVVFQGQGPFPYRTQPHPRHQQASGTTPHALSHSQEQPTVIESSQSHGLVGGIDAAQNPANAAAGLRPGSGLEPLGDENNQI
ncbi:hypothetical protein BGX31_004574 [Mortierella sp. GBA43]|nr:hypothetical protein BGX31_004574 [Mortierella sp. GBA43]